MNSLLWKIGGEAGSGIMTTGFDFARIASKLGYHIAGFAEYPSLVRGGYNTYEVAFSTDKIYSSKRGIDILVCLNKDTFNNNKERLHKGSLVIYDKESFTIEQKDIKSIVIPFNKIITDEGAVSIMINTIALGASFAALGWPLESYMELLKETFADKGDEVVAKNTKLAQDGYDLVVKKFGKLVLAFEKPEKIEPQLIMTGNDAFSLGAVIADCRLYSAYPMTPASSVLTQLAGWAEKTGMVVRHAEDEIAVMLTSLGGSYAGVRTAVGTSGGGFALMVESLSFAGVAEVPIVVFIAQRPGPATGMPTWTEQGDLLFTAHAGHGEFPRIILAPGDIEEMYKLTAEAFDFADIYQTPVIVLSDKHLSESIWSTPKMVLKLFARIYEPRRGKVVRSVDGQYLRYKISEDGISPILQPGKDGHFYQINSYEHLEDGHTTEDHQQRVAQVDKRNRKEKTYLMSHFKKPQLYGVENADIVLVAWGSLKGALLDCLSVLKEKGINAGLMHFTHIFPLDESVGEMFADNKRYILVENNSYGQFGRILKEQVGVEIRGKFLKYDGRQIFAEEVADFVEHIVKRSE